MASTLRTLLVIGSGPGIGRSVATLFTTKRYTNVILVARRADSLKAEAAAVEKAASDAQKPVQVRTVAVDITDTDALLKALDGVDAELGQPECVFFNAARVLPSAFFEHDVREVEYDFKITVSALYTIAKRYMPHLASLAQSSSSDSSASRPQPALIVTSSMLPTHPIPQLFALSLTKAAQRNLVQSLDLQYGSQGVHIGVINVAGPVTPDDPVRNPTIIAQKTWEWLEAVGEKSLFEVVI